VRGKELSDSEHQATRRSVPWRRTVTAHRVRAPRVRAFLLLLAAGLTGLVLTSCNTPFLERDGVASARAPVQAQVAARLDQTALPVFGEVHDAACTGGQDNFKVHEDYEFFCYTREVRVVDLGQAEVGAALDEADRAVSAVCGEPLRPLSDAASATGKKEAPPFPTQLGCADITLDVLVAAPDDPRLRDSSMFSAPSPRGQITAPPPPGLDAAKNAGSRYVLCLLGRKEFYRKMR